MLSERQLNILSCIHDYIAENGFAPTIREICQAAGIASSSVIQYQVNQMVARGYLIKSPGISRSLKLTNRSIWRGANL